MTDPNRSDQEPQERPTIRDRRRIDPETYEVRKPAGEAAAAADPGPTAEPGPTSGSGPVAGSEASEQVAPNTTPAADATETEADLDPRDVTIEDLKAQVAERTDDLQRLQAEYVNYKRRVDRERETSRVSTITTVLAELLPVLDVIDAARQHDELTGGFGGVAEGIEKVTRRHGLAAFGEVGDPFDPQLHDALMQLSDPGEEHPVCAQVFQVGYKVGDRVIRPARVAVGAPEAVPPASQGDGGGSATDGVGSTTENGTDVDGSAAADPAGDE
ncbi:nucleotide exchange factor GrpE [Propionibacteriaceae bacterium Y2011]